jgi:hypothetical protein
MYRHASRAALALSALITTTLLCTLGVAPAQATGIRTVLSVEMDNGLIALDVQALWQSCDHYTATVVMRSLHEATGRASERIVQWAPGSDANPVVDAMAPVFLSDHATVRHAIADPGTPTQYLEIQMRSGGYAKFRQMYNPYCPA